MEDNTMIGQLTLFHDLTASTIYLMGISFLLGSFMTILVLILLDFMRARSQNGDSTE